ncbi:MULTISPECIES: two-component system response regulator RssB [Proteus]|uniref:two-component system response regulator RssB n=1 Tax=Proteus TaxID=583 RepID=UPI000B4E579F|nr:two-component system response regulator RssB [Proteus terrae]MDY3693097.1 two-component system response regulator RssB [Proteus mirabilis]PNL50490.1 two-component system response regulator RssB [Proteus mirabilis]
MNKALVGKKILIIDDEVVFRTMLTEYFSHEKACVYTTDNGSQALSLLEGGLLPDLILCDIRMPVMNGPTFLCHLEQRKLAIPVIAISCTDNMAEIDDMLRLGAQEIFLKPITHLDKLKQKVIEVLCPGFFESVLIEGIHLEPLWNSLRKDTHYIQSFIKQMQPQVKQVVAGYCVNYRQLNDIAKMGLLFDIAALSEDQIIFYCVDISRDDENGLLVALLLRVVFNDVLKSSEKMRSLPSMYNMLNKLNKMLNEIGVKGQFPITLGYYHTQKKNILLASAGLKAEIKTESKKFELNSGIPLGTLQLLYINQVKCEGTNWQCKIWDNTNQIKLMFSPIYKS